MIRNSIKIFTDGSSRGNPGPGGFGAIIVYGDKVEEIGGREENTTNNRMELIAAIRALEKVDEILKSFKPQALSSKLYSDSAYLINGITKWVYGWKKNGWKTKAKQGVENQDLWKALDKLVADKQIEWQKVEGHSGHGANERCDEIATSFADNLNPKLYSGLASNYKISLEIDIPAKKEILYVSFVDEVGKIHSSWLDCELEVLGKSGARFKKVRSREEAQKIIADWKKE